MPIDRSRYPENWDEIALAVKEAADWICKGCSKQCLRPGEGSQLNRRERAVFTLTVHHCDYTPENNQPNNLIALCAPCHLGKHRGGKRNISPGQLSLEFVNTSTLLPSAGEKST